MPLVAAVLPSSHRNTVSDSIKVSGPAPDQKSKLLSVGNFMKRPPADLKGRSPCSRTHLVAAGCNCRIKVPVLPPRRCWHWRQQDGQRGIGHWKDCIPVGASLEAQLVKNPTAMWETWVRSWVGKIPWRRERLPIPVFWPGEFPGLYSPKELCPKESCPKDLDTTERLSLTH